jgi:hypothetical protein
MKKNMVIGALVGVCMILLVAAPVRAQTSGLGCAYCGRSFSSGGYVPPGYYSPQNIGPVYDRGMMGEGYHGSSDIEYEPQMNHLRYMPMYERDEPLNQEEAKARVQEWVNAIGNPNVKVGSVQDKGETYLVSVVTKKEGSLVDEIKVYKYTGDMRFVRVKAVKTALKN